MESSMFFGNTCQNGLLPALVRPTLPSVQTSMSMKQFLPIPLDTASAVGLFPGFNTSQAVFHYKGTKHAKKLKSRESSKSKLKGSAVTKETTIQEMAKGVNISHVPNGTNRKDGAAPPSVIRFMKPSVTPAAPSPAPFCSQNSEANPDSGGDEGSKVSPPSEAGVDHEAEPETEEEKARRLLYCSLCKVAVNSASQLDAHNSGTKHKTMLEARSGVGTIKSFPRPGVRSKLASSSKSSTGLQNKTFYCETCDVHVNSEIQLKQHISSRRHKDRAAGKPAKPKFSPYSKPQKGPLKQPIKLILGKELRCQPLTAQILPAHLAAMAAAAIGHSFAQRRNNAFNPALTPGFFQTQNLPAALLRPAPGPVRTSHPPVLFAPY